MQTITTTRWSDEVNTDISHIESILLSDHPDELSDTSISYINWKIEKKFEDNLKMILNGREVEFNYYSFSVDKVPSGMPDDTVRRTGFIIPYCSLGKIRYIIDRNSDAQTLLRKMLFYSKKGEIVRNNVPVSGDMFVWLINKVYKGENLLESESESLKNLSIDSIRGFKGNTEDSLTKVSTSGETVMNIISSLSFLIESQNLNQITLDVAYGKHSNIEVSLSKRATVATSIDRYLGELNQKESHEIVATLLLLLYSEILPIIIQNYQTEIEATQWGQGKCVEFLQEVANDLAEKVKLRIEDLTSRPEQLRLQLDTDHSEEADE